MYLADIMAVDIITPSIHNQCMCDFDRFSTEYMNATYT